MLFPTTTIVFALNTLWMMCQAVPLLDLGNSLEQNVLDAMVTTACSSNGRCWEWLPVQEVHEDVSATAEDLSMSKINVRREASSIDPTTVIETWNDDPRLPTKKMYQSSLVTKQTGNRLTKKDAVTSRSRGAGGMPFSVLYMNPPGSRGNHASTAQQQIGKTESSTPTVTHSNSRIMLRNGNSMQPRRHYSIIPQLFISYGWGPFGKWERDSMNEILISWFWYTKPTVETFSYSFKTGAIYWHDHYGYILRRNFCYKYSPRITRW